jgi:hypothetical protein
MLNLPMPAIAHVYALPNPGELPSLAGTAAQAREWMSLPELHWFAELGEIDLGGAWICEGGYDDRAPHLQSFPSLGAFSLASYSLQLLAEDYLAALARRSVGANTSIPRTAWYSSVDRILLFGHAAALRRDGFEVVRYGCGSLTVRAARARMHELRAHCMQAGLMIPVANLMERTRGLRQVQQASMNRGVAAKGRQ